MRHLFCSRLLKPLKTSNSAERLFLTRIDCFQKYLPKHTQINPATFPSQELVDAPYPFHSTLLYTVVYICVNYGKKQKQKKKTQSWVI